MIKICSDFSGKLGPLAILSLFTRVTTCSNLIKFLWSGSWQNEIFQFYDWSNVKTFTLSHFLYAVYPGWIKWKRIQFTCHRRVSSKFWRRKEKVSMYEILSSRPKRMLFSHFCALLVMLDVIYRLGSHSIKILAIDSLSEVLDVSIQLDILVQFRIHFQ